MRKPSARLKLHFVWRRRVPVDGSRIACGNRLWTAANVATNEYTANSLNQYTSVSADTNLVYDADGNMTGDGTFAYAYDAENRLVSVYPTAPTLGSLAVESRYDHRHRRIRKIVKNFDGEAWEIARNHTFVWDGNNIVLERVEFANGTTRTFEYFWGADKSGSEQGAGGVGGLLAVSVDGMFYIPCYDHNGNVVLYVSEMGSIAAQYTYDPYGNVIDSNVAFADVFNFGFSTKYHDRETDTVSYQRRFYSPALGRWLNRDPIEEEGGENLYAFCGNNPILYYDILGMSFWDDLIDASKVAVGLCTAISGAMAGAATSWTGAGAVAGGIVFALGVDQMIEGLNSIAIRAHGGPASDNSPIKDIISTTSQAITRRSNSDLEYYMQQTYSAIQLTSTCYSGIVTARSVIKAINFTYVPPHSEVVPVLHRTTIQLELELKASYWKISGVGDAVSGAFGLMFQGVSIIEHDNTEVDNK